MRYYGVHPIMPIINREAERRCALCSHFDRIGFELFDFGFQGLDLLVLVGYALLAEVELAAVAPVRL